MRFNWSLFVIAYLIPFTSHAQDGAYTHEKLRFSISAGIAGGNVTNKVHKENLFTAYGTAFATDARLGYNISEHLALDGGVVLVHLNKPRISFQGYDNGKREENLALDEYFFGAGLTWNCIRWDSWVSLLAGPGYMVAKDKKHNSSSTTDAGISFQIKACKDFWVSPGLTLGVGAMYMKSYIENKFDGGTEVLGSNRFSFMLVMGMD